MIIDPLMPGKQSGSVGGVTYVTVDGVRIVKSKNPKRSKYSPMSYGQRRTQARYATCMGAYHVMKPLLERTLMKTKPLQKVNGLFLQCNSSSLEALLTKKENEAGNTLLCHYVVSRGDGSLPPVECVEEGDKCLTDIRLGDLVITPQTTLGDLSMAVMLHNEHILTGDALTFVFCTQKVGDENNHTTFRMGYRTLVMGNTLSFKSGMTLDTLVGPGLLSSVEREGVGNVLALRMEDYRLVTVVHSRMLKDHSVTSSEQRLVGRNPLLERYSSPEALDEAIRSFGPIKETNLFSPGPTYRPAGSLEDYFG